MLNCNSLNNKLREVKEMLQESAPAVFCLTETWLDKHVPKFYNNFAEWKHRGQRGGGLGTLIRKDIVHNVFPLIQFQNGTLEIQAIKLYLNNDKHVIIVNIYNPNQAVTTAEINFYLDQLNEEFIIVGDLNAHSSVLSTNAKLNATGKSLEETLLNRMVCLINPVNLYTYVDRKSGKKSCLNICLTSPNLAPLATINAERERERCW